MANIGDKCAEFSVGELLEFLSTREGGKDKATIASHIARCEDHYRYLLVLENILDSIARELDLSKLESQVRTARDDFRRRY